MVSAMAHLSPRIVGTFLLALVVALALAARVVVAADDATPSVKGPHGWTAGTPATGTADALSVPDPVAVEIPKDIADKVQGDTALFYFSPTCPHCQAAAPEIAQLASRPDLRWIGVATGTSTKAELDAFRQKYKIQFEFVVDASHEFARSLGARSTPSLYLVRPDPAKPTAAPGMVSVLLFEAYTPWRRGLGGYLMLRRHPSEPFRDFSGYQSDATCGACHTDEMASWYLTNHAAAFRTLYRRQRADDLSCVGCHVTGLDSGGFVVGDLSSPYVDVTCESCHGPSGPHDGQPTDATTACAGCHDDKHSVAFSLDKGLPLIDHYKIDAMSAEEIDARIQALARGEVSHPLLAFPEGQTVGSAACQSCHRGEHKDWRSSPHARAFTALQEPDRQKLECVGCHATASASGPSPREIDGYRTDEGVGCESCHGPGTAHVAKPTKDNIIGLGESCPECVIESICTSCHTPAWDPNWELKPRLAAAKHGR